MSALIVSKLNAEKHSGFYKEPEISIKAYIVGVVGALQFEVFGYRLKREYGVETRMQPLSYRYTRWIQPDDFGELPELEQISKTSTTMLVLYRIIDRRKMATLTDIIELTSNKTRLRIIVLMAQAVLCSCQIQDVLNISKATTKRHLKTLAEKGMIICELRDNHKYYVLKMGDSVMMDLIKSLLGNIEHYPLLRADQLKLAKYDNSLC
ncbi:MAG: ArsR family transcriptional regulator [Bacillota bacterium]|nr:ArsR family transcriptional regulator [Bacillota bacterium]